MTTVIGNIVDAHQVEEAAIQTVKDYAAGYLNDLSAMRNWTGPKLPAPRSYTTINRFGRPQIENQLPALVVISPGLIDAPTADGNGLYTAEWALGLAVIVSARTQEETNFICKLYTAALRAIIVQHKDLGGIATGTRWMDESYDDTPMEGTRSIAVGNVMFGVEVRGVVDWKLGPANPATPPGDPGYGDWPTIQTVDVDVIMKGDTVS